MNEHRIYQLDNEIENIQDKKLQILKEARSLHGVEKASKIEEFLDLNKQQEQLEADLAKLESE